MNDKVSIPERTQERLISIKRSVNELTNLTKNILQTILEVAGVDSSVQHTVSEDGKFLVPLKKGPK